MYIIGQGDAREPQMTASHDCQSARLMRKAARFNEPWSFMLAPFSAELAS